MDAPAGALGYVRSHWLIFGLFAADLIAMVFGMPTAVFPALALSVFSYGPADSGSFMRLQRQGPSQHRWCPGPGSTRGKRAPVFLGLWVSLRLTAKFADLCFCFGSHVPVPIQGFRARTSRDLVPDYLLDPQP